MHEAEQGQRHGIPAMLRDLRLRFSNLRDDFPSRLPSKLVVKVLQNVASFLVVVPLQQLRQHVVWARDRAILVYNLPMRARVCFFVFVCEIEGTRYGRREGKGKRENWDMNRSCDLT